ncbi:MAG: DUF523 domain-containing protein [Clostridia bacterium]|nr:DUF523 domain-containing protein [Clostridia bacterium]
MGENVKYNGGNNQSDNPILAGWVKEGRAIPICPETEGGLSTPREPSEIQGDKVINCKGCDVTEEFICGARIACQKAKETKAKYALMKQGSPSCGSKTISDGTFTGTKKQGMGIAARLLSDMGVKIFDENEIEKLDKILDK